MILHSINPSATEPPGVFKINVTGELLSSSSNSFNGRTTFSKIFSSISELSIIVLFFKRFLKY